MVDLRPLDPEKNVSEDAVELASSSPAVVPSSTGEDASCPPLDSQALTEEHDAIHMNQGSSSEETDDDDSSSSSEYSTESWFRWSNAFFFFGSIFYVWSAIVGVIDYYRDDYYDGTDDDEAWDDDGSDDDEETYPFWTVYKVLASGGALMYLGNSISDLRVSIVEMQAGVSARYGDDPRWEIGVACTFGVAAICDLVGELIWDDNRPAPGYAAGSAAVHVYLLNAVMTVWGRFPAFSSLPKALMSAGDILFLIGSIIDVLISYIDNPLTMDSWARLIAWSALVSAVLWFLDAILYILADCVSTGGEDGYGLVSHASSGSDHGSDHDEVEFGSTVSASEAATALRCRIVPNTEQHHDKLDSL